MSPPTQYATDGTLAARHRLWSSQQGGMRLVEWVLGLVDWEGWAWSSIVGCGNGCYLDALQACGLTWSAATCRLDVGWGQDPSYCQR